MNEKSEVSTVACLTLTRLLTGPIETVWQHLTTTSLLPAWFGDDSHIEPPVGGAVRLMGGHIRGVVTQWQPPTRLIYTWNVATQHGCCKTSRTVLPTGCPVRRRATDKPLKNCDIRDRRGEGRQSCIVGGVPSYCVIDGRGSEERPVTSPGKGFIRHG